MGSTQFAVRNLLFMKGSGRDGWCQFDLESCNKRGANNSKNLWHFDTWEKNLKSQKKISNNFLESQKKIFKISEKNLEISKQILKKKSKTEKTSKPEVDPPEEENTQAI